MAGGSSAHGVAGAHGATPGHGASADGAPADAGPAELPPAPNTRWISPDREAYATAWPGRLLFWPVIWLIVAVVFGGLALRHQGTVDPAKRQDPAKPGAVEPTAR